MPKGDRKAKHSKGNSIHPGYDLPLLKHSRSTVSFDGCVDLMIGNPHIDVKSCHVWCFLGLCLWTGSRRGDRQEYDEYEDDTLSVAGSVSTNSTISSDSMLLNLLIENGYRKGA